MPEAWLLESTAAERLREAASEHERRDWGALLERVREGILAEGTRENAPEAVLERARRAVHAAAPHWSPAAKERLAAEVAGDLSGFGPIQRYLDDPEVSEVMINGVGIWIERAGAVRPVEERFRDHEHVRLMLEKILNRTGRRLDESTPMVDTRLPDGSRINAVIPPVALDGPSVTIRKFRPDMTPEAWARLGTAPEACRAFLAAAVTGRLNLLVSGGTGSGKTSTLNVLSAFIPEDERIVTIEDAAELQLRQRHVVRLETRPPNMEGRGGITVRDLVRNALRMRPDRIVVGEVRGGEALDMLQAMNTGHDGGLTTAHANSPADALARLETMALMAGADLPHAAIREQIASAVDLVVHQARLRDGRRRVVAVAALDGLDRAGAYRLREVWRWEGGDGEAGGLVPALDPEAFRHLRAARRLERRLPAEEAARWLA